MYGGRGDTPIEDSPTVEGPTCRLLGPTALVVQGIMGVLVILSLVYKRFRESPQRPWRIWLFDVHKQIVGQMFVHGVNVAISDTLQRISEGNACVFYFLNILVDTTAGVGIIYLVLRFLTETLTTRFGLAGFKSGEYGTPPSFIYWIRQTAVYVLSITSMKLVVVGLFAVWPGIFNVGHWLLSWTGDGSNFQIIFTMGLFPIAMNILQFWLIDSIVKATHQPPVLVVDEQGDAADREPLFRASEDESDDDDETRRRDIEASRPRPSRTPSRSSVTKKDTLEPKSTGSVTPDTSASVPSSSSRTGASFSTHAYPPRGSSISGSIDDNSPTSARSNSSRRRSPPPPLLPRSPMVPAMNSPSCMPSAKPDTPAQVLREKVARRTVSARKQEEKEKEQDDWNVAWGDDGDDWAERVGEEDWTGRRVEAARGFVGAAWDGRAPQPPTPISVG